MIRGTSNQSIKTNVKSVVSQGYETGPDPGVSGGGGAGFPVEGSAEYREMDNSAVAIVWYPSDHHLPNGTPQVIDNTP